MKLRMKFAALICCAITLATPAQKASAQMSMAPYDPAPALGSQMHPSQALDAMLSLFEGECMGVAKTMPADKYSFAPSAPNFAAGSPAKFEGVRTFAQEATHLIQANYYFYSVVSGAKPDVDMKAIAAMTTKEQIVPALAASFAFAHKSIATITPQNAFETIKGADGMQTRATLAAFGVAHGYDHYGQMVEYLRMNGLVPPGSK
jgi:uncharacterized damage-inducible protein DinB